MTIRDEASHAPLNGCLPCAVHPLAPAAMQTAQCLRAPRCVVAVQPCSSSRAPSLVARQAFKAAAKQTRRAASMRVMAEGSAAATSNSASAEAVPENFIPVCRPEDLPKGTRKEVRVEGKAVLLFWYRNQIYAIEARSPAEGAYSEGFANAKFTQDYCIECPSTGTLFSLQDGSIVSWYPNNPVLRMLTPQDTCRSLEVYPVKLTQDLIEVDVSGSVYGARSTKGGSNTSLENNNVYGLEPKMYVESGEAAESDAAARVGAAATLVAGTLAALGTFGAIYWFFFYKA